MAAHHEIHFEEYITKKLVANGWVEGAPEAYDKQTALYPEDVVAWVQKTQPEAWEKIVRNNNGDAPKVLVQKLAKALDSKNGSTIKVLRDGFSFAGAGKIDMIQRAPEDARNTKTVAKYKENILRVVRQLKYCPTREWAIDLVFFINGIPVATVAIGKAGSINAGLLAASILSIKYPNINKTLTEWFTESCENLPTVISTGGVWSKENADDLLKQGADLVGVGKVGIGYPDWAKEVMKKKYDLRILAVHYDNTWNTAIATQNIKKIINNSDL